MFLSSACVDICVCASFSLIFILDQTGKERGSKLGIDMSKQEVAVAVGTGRDMDTKDDGPNKFSKDKLHRNRTAVILPHFYTKSLTKIP